MEASKFLKREQFSSLESLIRNSAYTHIHSFLITESIFLYFCTSIRNIKKKIIHKSDINDSNQSPPLITPDSRPGSLVYKSTNKNTTKMEKFVMAFCIKKVGPNDIFRVCVMPNLSKWEYSVYRRTICSTNEARGFTFSILLEINRYLT